MAEPRKVVQFNLVWQKKIWELALTWFNNWWFSSICGCCGSCSCCWYSSCCYIICFTEQKASIIIFPVVKGDSSRGLLNWPDKLIKGQSIVQYLCKLPRLKVTKPIFQQIPSNSGNSQNGGVSEVSESLVWSSIQARLALPATFGEPSSWWEIQNLYMRFVLHKVRNPLHRSI